MMGFLYSPSTLPEVAWTAALNGNVQGPRDPVPFVAYVNYGNGFDSSTYRFIAPHSGLYYVIMTGASTGSMPMKMNLLLNGVLKAGVAYEMSGVKVSRSRAIILRLNVDEELRASLPAGYELGGSYLAAEFLGFRIMP